MNWRRSTPRRQSAAAGQVHVLSESFATHNRANSRRNLDSTLVRVGLAPWRPAFQILRRSCETEWSNLGIPEAAYVQAIGHSPEISRRFYVQVFRDAYRAVSQNQAVPQQPHLPLAPALVLDPD